MISEFGCDQYRAIVEARLNSSISKSTARYTDLLLSDLLLAESKAATHPLAEDFRATHQVLQGHLMRLVGTPFEILEDFLEKAILSTTLNDPQKLLIREKSKILQQINPRYLDRRSVSILAREVLANHIYPYMNLKDLKNISNTCWAFCELFKSDSLWKYFCNKYYGYHMFGVTKSPSWRNLFFAIHTQYHQHRHPETKSTDSYFMVQEGSNEIVAYEECILGGHQPTEYFDNLLNSFTSELINAKGLMWRLFIQYRPFTIGRRLNEWVRCLTKHGADPNLPFKNQSLLGFAVENSWVEVAEILIECGASLDHPSVVTALNNPSQVDEPPMGPFITQYLSQNTTELYFNDDDGIWNHRTCGMALIDSVERSWSGVVLWSNAWIFRTHGFAPQWNDAGDVIDPRTKRRCYFHEYEASISSSSDLDCGWGLFGDD